MKTLTLILALLFVFGCVASGWGQQQTTPEQPKKSSHPIKGTQVEKALVLSGEILSIDTTVSTITVKDKSGKVETFKIDPKATFRKAGKTATLKDFSTGKKVSISYKPEANEKIATGISMRVQSVKRKHVPKK
jgi:hypothetical protein